MITVPTSATPEVSILIVTRIQPEMLDICLRSIGRHFPAGIAAEVVIVMNEPTESVRGLVRKGCHGVVVAESPVNLGLAGGYNLARSLARGRLLLLLHDDAELLPGSVESLISALRERPEAGAVGSRLLNADGSHQLSGALLWNNAWTTQRTLSPLETTAFPVDYVTLCATLTPVEAWDAVGGLDEAIYPGFYVDADYSTALWAVGRPVYCEPAATVIHRRGTSGNVAFATFLSERNRPYFAKKWAATLTEREPWAPDDPDSESRARARAEEREKRREISPQPSRDPASDADREARHLRLALRLYEDWSRHLKTEWSKVRDEADELGHRVDQMRSERDAARSAQLAQAVKIEALREKIKVLQGKKAKPRRDWRFWRRGRG